MKVIIDRFEEEFAVCETESKEMINIETAALPDGVESGMVLNVEEDVITIDLVETERLKKEIELLTKDLWEWYVGKGGMVPN